MGNIDSRAKFEGGYLFVKTDKPFYYPNNIVYGKIYIRAEVPLQPKNIEIQVKGKEETFFYTEDGDDGEGNTNPKKYWTYTKDHIKFKATCFSFPLNYGPLNPGDYIIPFEFKLPDNIPASMLFEYGGISDGLKMDETNAK